jgi:hypothetical protein
VLFVFQIMLAARFLEEKAIANAVMFEGVGSTLEKWHDL